MMILPPFIHADALRIISTISATIHIIHFMLQSLYVMGNHFQETNHSDFTEILGTIHS